MPQGNKILSIQYLRGLAALGVVLCHYSMALPIPKLLKTVFDFGQAGVHVFFLISGFIIVFSLIKADYKVNKFFIFLAKRSIRIDPAYYATVILTILLFEYFVAISHVKGNEFNFIPGQFLAHLIYIVPFTDYPFYMHVFWTLCVEFQFYLVIGLLFFLWDNRVFKLIFLIIFSALSFKAWPNGYYLVLNYSTIFSAGIWLVYLYRQPSWFNRIVTGFFLVLAERRFGIPIFILLSCCCLIILYSKQIIKPLSFLGDISYSLYLTHTLIFAILLKVVVKFNLHTDNYALLWLFIETIIAIMAAYCFYLLIEKPSLRLSKRIFYKK
jgi:exopolysaccharide production protein ExoZ